MEYSGMTVNERIYVSGNDKKFDTAVKNKDKKEVIKILTEVQLSDENIIVLLKHIGLE
jgi:hypothetical protein